MGMFDYLRTKIALPTEPSPPAIEWFQTKDTEDISGQLYMEKWTIEADGRLVHHNADYEWKPNENEPADSFERYAGALKRINERDEERAYHGDIRFYHFDDRSKEWWEYVARFTNGKCEKIWCEEHRGPEGEDHDGR